MTPDEARILGAIQRETGNSLSSVFIGHTTRGNTWEVKVYHEDAEKANEIAQKIEQELNQKYGNKNQN